MLYGPRKPSRISRVLMPPGQLPVAGPAAGAAVAGGGWATAPSGPHRQMWSTLAAPVPHVFSMLQLAHWAPRPHPPDASSCSSNCATQLKPKRLQYLKTCSSSAGQDKRRGEGPLCQRAAAGDRQGRGVSPSCARASVDLLFAVGHAVDPGGFHFYEGHKHLAPAGGGLALLCVGTRQGHFTAEFRIARHGQQAEQQGKKNVHGNDERVRTRARVCGGAVAWPTVSAGALFFSEALGFEVASLVC